MSERYFLKPDIGRFPWGEVSKAEWVHAERAAGFHNTMGRPEEPATGGFSGNGMRGTVTYGGSEPRSDGSEPEPSELVRLREFARWVVSLDDPDPQSQGFQDRRTVTMTTIIRRAEDALGES
jgi:hypothetical protein